MLHEAIADVREDALVDWFADYLVDTGQTHERQASAAADRVVREQNLYLFVTDRPVAMATISG